jgi:hypothetical protein
VWNGYGVPCMSFVIRFSFCSSRFLALDRCFAMAIDVLRLAVCWNQVDGVAVWCVSPCVSVDSSHQMALTPCSGCCGEFDANVQAGLERFSFQSKERNLSNHQCSSGHHLWRTPGVRIRLFWTSRMVCSRVVWWVGNVFPAFLGIRVRCVLSVPGGRW